MVKIGVSDYAELRLEQLQPHSPVELYIIGYMRGGIKLERSLHRKFAHLHSHHEWFHLTDEIISFIKAANYENSN